MSFFGTVRSIGEAIGAWRPDVRPIGCTVGRVAFRETKRAAWLVNRRRPVHRLRAETRTMLRTLFPELDVDRIRIRTGCRLPANRFMTEGSIYGMTFGYSIYRRDRILDEDDASDLVKLIHEVVHVEQTRRLGGESSFACAYGEGYLEGGGSVPARIRNPTAYHRNPLESEAYEFDNRFRDANGRADASLLPLP